MIRGASIIFIGQDREKIIFAENETEPETETETENDEELHDKLMHRKESEFS